MPSSLLLVVAAVITKDDQILLSQRPSGKNMAGYWEFPGGKVNRGEIIEHALCRELREELGIKVSPLQLQPLTFASQSYKRFHFLMPVFKCTHWEGDISSCEGQKLAWLPLDQFNELIKTEYKILPNDLPIIPQVMLLLDQLKE